MLYHTTIYQNIPYNHKKRKIETATVRKIGIGIAVKESSIRYIPYRSI